MSKTYSEATHFLCSVQHIIISHLPFIVYSLKAATFCESFLTTGTVESC